MTLLINWAKSGDYSISVRMDFCCDRAAEAYKAGILIDVPFYAIGLPPGWAVAYCPFCGAKVVSINIDTGERLVWAKREGKAMRCDNDPR